MTKISSSEVEQVFSKHGGNIRATAKELNISRSSVRRKLAPLGKMKKPIVAGSIEGTPTLKRKLPAPGQVARYILTSAQNNTHVHDSAWINLQALAKHYQAEIIVGTYSYNQNQYGKLSVKRGKDKFPTEVLWYDPQVVPFIHDERIELAKGLVWCGEMNILPTAVNPLAGLEAYSARKSAIFPHAKLAVRSIPTMQGEGVKFNYTTGTVTQRNYIQKREGVIAEFHHIYGGLLVEVNSDGNWWVRQLNEDSNGVLQDLDVISDNGKITTGNRVEAVTHGDLHGTFADPEIVQISQQMVDALQPKYQFLHDVLEGAPINPHERKHGNNHAKFATWLRGYHRLDAELASTAKILVSYDRPFSKTVIVESNHDSPWIVRWLQEYDYRKDPANAELFLRLQKEMYRQLRAGKMPRDINMLEYALRDAGYYSKAKFLIADESYLICGRKIQCGMHGHLGPNGKFASPDNLSKMGRRANTAHTHSAGVYNGLYVAGTTSKLRWNYATGPISWNHTHIITYKNGKRTLVTIYGGKWRA